MKRKSERREKAREQRMRECGWPPCLLLHLLLPLARWQGAKEQELL